MFKDFLARIWKRAPRILRLWSMRVVHTRFTVTAGVIVLDREGRVLLLMHRFRGGSGWGIPGGFIEANEQPVDAARRELREEVGLDIERPRVVASRSFPHVKQIEIVFLGYAKGEAEPRSAEIKKAGWFSPHDLPEGLPRDQTNLLKTILLDGANHLD